MAIETGFRCVPSILDSERVGGGGKGGWALIEKGCLFNIMSNLVGSLFREGCILERGCSFKETR